MSHCTNASHGNFKVPSTKKLRDGFERVTRAKGVNDSVQQELLRSCKTPEETVELLDHLMHIDGVNVPDIIPGIRLNSVDSQSLALREHYVRSKDGKTATAGMAAR